MPVVENFFNVLLPDAMSKNPQNFQEIGYQYNFQITGEGGGRWYVNASNSGPLVQQGNLDEFDCHITMSAEDCEQCCENANNFIPLPFSGRAELTGNAMALGQVLKIFRLGN